MVNDHTLREHARKAIQEGALPSRLPDKVWAGAATMGACAVCGQPLADGVEFELVFADAWRTVEKSCCVHPLCLKAFEHALQDLLEPSGTKSQRNGQDRPISDGFRETSE